ncbi:metal ABC transporter permease [Planctomicrobium sp. SH668]|uniref:metal ABC transporter permease n=1 Tax=Planctomicrobium sp. SH668 TaxID=3448126 RepID=UPI003F5B33FD
MMTLLPTDSLLSFLPTVAVASGFSWHYYDTAIVIVAALAAMSCTLPGVWLVLRQQSMMGDALSHTALPGVVLAYLFGQWLKDSGWITAAGLTAIEPLLLITGAIVIGILTAILTESVQKLGRVEGNAALGVVFTSLFALGLLLIRLTADDIHLDPECVLFGQIELTVLDSVPIGGIEIPMAALTNGALLIINGILLMLFFKELRVAAFDSEMATSLGIPAGTLHYLLMGVTAATVVTAFTSVGSILVVAILIVPAACSQLVCNRLWTMISLSLIIAALSAIVGHVLSKTLPVMIFSRLGFPNVQDAGTSGMMAVACGIFFVLFMLFSPQDGLMGRWIAKNSLVFRMATDDILAALFRSQESSGQAGTSPTIIRKMASWISPLTWRLALWRLRAKGLVAGTDSLHLTATGMEQASELVRSHRLWESYLHKHFQLDGGTLHGSADRVEHYLDRDLQAQLDVELDSPHLDPHGKSIPAREESSNDSRSSQH